MYLHMEGLYKQLNSASNEADRNKLISAINTRGSEDLVDLGTMLTGWYKKHRRFCCYSDDKSDSALTRDFRLEPFEIKNYDLAYAIYKPLLRHMYRLAFMES